MPKKPPHICNAPGCTTVVVKTYCTRHTKPPKPKDLRPSAYRRGYGGARWERVRKKVLSRDVICQHCMRALAVAVDHIIPKSEGGAAWDLDNLQGLCVPCHSIKTRREQLARSRKHEY